MTRLRITALMLALGVPAWCQWERTVIAGDGPQTDTPAPHPLIYFTSDPSLLEKGRRNCEMLRENENSVATWAATLSEDVRSHMSETVKSHPNPYTFAAKTRQVGKVAGFNIVEAQYYCVENGDAGAVKGKSILVQTGQDAYREIFHIESFFPRLDLTPPMIEEAGSERVLATLDYGGGSGGYCSEAYWWFNKDGPHQIDLSRVMASISAHMPEDTNNSLGACLAPNFLARTITTGVQRHDAKCHACDYVGTITARFRLNGWVAEPEEVVFKPGSPNER